MRITAIQKRDMCKKYELLPHVVAEIAEYSCDAEELDNKCGAYAMLCRIPCRDYFEPVEHK